MKSAVMGATGLEFSSISAGKTVVSSVPGANSGALDAPNGATDGAVGGSTGEADLLDAWLTACPVRLTDAQRADVRRVIDGSDAKPQHLGGGE